MNTSQHGDDTEHNEEVDEIIGVLNDKDGR